MTAPRHRAPLSSAPTPEQADLGGIGECFKKFWITHPRVRECAKLLRSKIPEIPPLFQGEHLYLVSGRGYCDARWPVHLNTNALLDVFRYCLPPEPPHINPLIFPAITYGAPRIGSSAWLHLVQLSKDAEMRTPQLRTNPVDQSLVNAANVLVVQSMAFFDELRGRQPKRIAFGTTPDRLVAPIDSEQWDRRGMWIGIEDDSVGCGDYVLCEWSGVKLRCGEQVREAETINRAADFYPGRHDDVAPAGHGLIKCPMP